MTGPLILIAGPTASGKSDLAMRLAQATQGAIVNGDAMQVYQGVEIGTAKPSLADQAKVPHYLVDCCQWNESFNAFRFQTLAREAIEELWTKQQLPIVVGGTGLYLQGLVEGYSFGPKRQDHQDLSLSQMMEAILEHLPHVTLDDLQGNERRIRRYYDLLVTQGHLPGRNVAPLLLTAGVYIDRDRRELYERINQRVDVMVERGLVDEAYQLYCALKQDPNLGQATLFQAIGYKELFPYFEGEASLEEVLSSLKQATRRYAKRQLTWYRNRMPYLTALAPESCESWIQKVQDKLKAEGWS